RATWPPRWPARPTAPRRGRRPAPPRRGRAAPPARPGRAAWAAARATWPSQREIMPQADGPSTRLRCQSHARPAERRPEVTDPVRVDREGAVALLTIDHPPANAVSRAVIAGLRDAVAEIGRENSGVRAAILTGQGERF